MEEKKTTQLTTYLTPVAIIIAGGFIAVAIFLSGATASTDQKKVTDTLPNTEEPTTTTNAVSPVTADDHIRGNPDALVKIIEYSDFECPFCKQLHNTLNTLIDEVGTSGDVAWVYRHFPLEQLHPKNAMKVAIASECAAEQGGDDMFWKFADAFFEITPANDRTDLTTVLPNIYTTLGLDRSKMESCVASGKYDAHIQAEIENAIATGGRGTPWSIVVTPNGKTFPLNGAQPLAAIEQLVELAKKEQ